MVRPAIANNSLFTNHYSQFNMKKSSNILIAIVAAAMLCGCASMRSVPWQKKAIPGLYEYTHSWTYPSPEGGYTITCYEEGTIDFDRAGYYQDRAIQYHTANTPEQTCWTYDYECQGRWDVANGLFLFNELAQHFNMELMGVNIGLGGDLEWAGRMADRIVQRQRPKSAQMIAFDIVVLNDSEFTWSYTYPDGHTDYWEMHRIN